MSRFICSSHSSSLQPCNHAANSERSSNESCSMAVLISGRLTSAILPSLNCSSKFRSSSRKDCRQEALTLVCPVCRRDNQAKGYGNKLRNMLFFERVLAERVSVDSRRD